MAPARGPRQSTERDGAHQAGLLCAGGALELAYSGFHGTENPEPFPMLMNTVPLILYAIACVRYAMQFARRSFNVSRAASTWLILGAFAHTFVIGMETMRVGHLPVAGATS